MTTNQRGFISTSFSKSVALEFAFTEWNENNPKIPVLL